MKYLVLLTLLFSISCASNDAKKSSDKAATATVTSPTPVVADAAKVDTKATPAVVGKKVAKAKAKAEPVAKAEATEASATPAAAGSASKLTCTSGSATRTLEITTDGGGCKLSYTKDGNTTNTANAHNGTTFCEDVRAKIQAKIEASGFKCN